MVTLHFSVKYKKSYAIPYLDNAAAKAYALEELVEAESSDKGPDGGRPQRGAQGHADDHRVHQDSQLQDLHHRSRVSLMVIRSSNTPTMLVEESVDREAGEEGIHCSVPIVCRRILCL